MPLFALVLRPWILRMRAHGVIPRTLADDVRIHATQSGLLVEGQPCSMLNRMRNAVEDTFAFMDNMGAAISASKSHCYASNSQLRREISQIQWGNKLSNERGGKLHHEFTAPALGASALLEEARQAIGRDIKQSTERPEGNYLIIDCDSAQHKNDYPVYLEVPAKFLPGLYAHTLAATIAGHFNRPKMPGAAVTCMVFSLTIAPTTRLMQEQMADPRMANNQGDPI